MPSLGFMTVCSDCGSEETTVKDLQIYCADCGLENGEEIRDSDSLETYTEEIFPSRASSNFNSDRGLMRSIYYEQLHENKKSPAHIDGLKVIQDYSNHKYGSKNEFVKKRQHPIIQQAKRIFEMGIKRQARTEMSTGSHQMFLPSGLSDSHIYAAYACILFAERQQSGIWNAGLSDKASHVLKVIMPEYRGRKLSHSEISKKIAISYKRLDKLVNLRKRIERITKSIHLKNNFIECVNLYTQKLNIPTPDNLLSSITEVERRLSLDQYQKQLEFELPQTGLDLISAEILYKLVKSTDSKTTRKFMMDILDEKRKLADKRVIVEKILLIIEL